MTTSAKGTALVTGASSGIGTIYVDRLARPDYNLPIMQALARPPSQCRSRQDGRDDRAHVSALTRLTYARSFRFVTRGVGTIINIASLFAIAPETMNGVYGGSRALMLAFSQSLHHEPKNVRVQVVLPGATATDFWNLAGTPVEHRPSQIVMPAEEMVDAALVGFDLGELVTIPSLPKAAELAGPISRPAEAYAELVS